MKLFDAYIFADYSGAQSTTAQRRAIRAWHSVSGSEPSPLGGKSARYSRSELRAAVELALDDFGRRGLRAVVGFDHQYSWPIALWHALGLGDSAWREAIGAIMTGANGLPALDHPARYCRALNAKLDLPVFWSRLPTFAERYGISCNGPHLHQSARFRLTESCSLTRVGTRPRLFPADQLGGQGAVAGQTICGFMEIGRLVDRPDVAWWPFDGFDINGPAYRGRHVAVEIYPTSLRPADVPQSDDADARWSCTVLAEADITGELATLLDLPQLGCDPTLSTKIRLEGWIVGLLPAGAARSPG